MSIVQKLKDDHRTLRNELDDLVNVAEERARRDKLREVIALANAHESAEERTMYRALMSSEGQKNTVLHGCEEQRVLKMMLDDLRSTEPISGRFQARVNVFRDILKHHLDTEERSVFPLLEERIEPAELEELGDRYDAAMNEVRQSMLRP